MMRSLPKFLLPAILLAASFFAAACQPGGAETVLLQGAVTIGPLSPVERPGESTPVPPEVFLSRHMVITDASGERLVREVYFTQIGSGATGYYTAQLAPGTYMIDINHTGMDMAEGLPQTITAAADETITIDVAIDTGIR